MFQMSSQKLEVSSEHERLLRDLAIDETGPGTIVQDFAALLAYLKGRDLRATGRHQLPLRALPEINARLVRPLQLGLTRPVQKSYPHINGLYLLVRASGLVAIGGTPKKSVLVVGDAVYRVWESLNPTERYCTLLETWLLRGHPEIIGGDRSPAFLVPETFSYWNGFFHRIPDEGMQVAGDDPADAHIRYLLGWHNLGLLELFGLVSVRHGSPEPGEGWRAERVWRTPLGDALLAALYVGFFGDFGNILQLGSEEYVPFGVLQPVLQPYFPAWQKCLAVPTWTFRDGVYVFKASLRGIWRRIAVPAGASLNGLSSAILNAYEFDHDHLHEFSYENRFGVREHVNHPFMDEGPWTNEVRVGDVPLGIGQTMTYVFDFGDWWEFDVTLERVDPPDASLEGPTVSETHGEAPDQYRSW